MQPFLLAYTNAFNKRYGRIGALFQGRCKARYVGKNEYLLHLSRYIHLNPVTAGLVKKAENWEFSSYRDYLGLRTGSILNPKIVLDQFHFPEEYRDFVEEALEIQEPGLNDLLFE